MEAPDLLPDIEAKITFLQSDGKGNGRNKPAYSGYRPAHLIRDDCLTTGQHHYYGDAVVQPGETVMGTVSFITPEVYPRTLWIGKIIRIQEASRIVGYAEVTRILNESLRKPEYCITNDTKCFWKFVGSNDISFC